MFCSNCSAWYPATANFCDRCGRPLTSASFGQLPHSPAPSPQTPNTAAEEGGPKGLGGWLIVVGGGLILGLAFRALRILQTGRLLSDASLAFIADPHSAGYIPGYFGIVKFELGAQVAFLMFSVLLAILFVRESRGFPGLWVVFLGLQVAFTMTDHLLLAHAIAGSPLQLQQRVDDTSQLALFRIIGMAIVATVWTAYMFRSKRVKATFVR